MQIPIPVPLSVVDIRLSEQVLTHLKFTLSCCLYVADGQVAPHVPIVGFDR